MGGLRRQRMAEDLRREVERIGGHDLEFEETAAGVEAVFTVPARAMPDALATGEKVMRAVSTGGFWFGASPSCPLVAEGAREGC